MTLSDCFRILGIPRNACINDLKDAYRSKAKIYHPDRNGGDGLQFNRLHEAYTFLLDSGSLQMGTTRPDLDRERKEADERLRREVLKKSADVKKHREAMKRAERECARKVAEEKAALARRRKEAEKKAVERRAAFEDQHRMSQLKASRERAQKLAKENSPTHLVFTAGELLTGKGSDRQKKQAIQTLVSLKRKSAYPFLKTALYEGSEVVVLSTIEAIGKLKIIQASPELCSLMCSGSVKIRMAVLEAVENMDRIKHYRDIVLLAVGDSNMTVRQKAETLFQRSYG